MSKWLPQYKVLALALLILFVVLLGTYLYFVQPLKQQVDSLTEQVVSQSRTIRSTGWAADEHQLLRIKDGKKKELEVLDARAREVWSLVAGTFADKLADYEGDEQLFMDQVTRLDYADAYTTTLHKLETTGKLEFDPSVLRLGEDSLSPHVYEMVLQLWTLDKVMLLALLHDVVPVRKQVEVPLVSADNAPSVDQQTGETEYVTRNISQVTLLPPRSYSIHAGDEQPYLLEVPLVFKAACTPQSLHNFMKELSDCKQGRLLVLNHLEIHGIPAGSGENENRLEVRMEIAAFVQLRNDLKMNPSDRYEGTSLREVE